MYVILPLTTRLAVMHSLSPLLLSRTALHCQLEHLHLWSF